MAGIADSPAALEKRLSLASTTVERIVERAQAALAEGDKLANSNKLDGELDKFVIALAEAKTAADDALRGIDDAVGVSVAVQSAMDGGGIVKADTAWRTAAARVEMVESAVRLAEEAQQDASRLLARMQTAAAAGAGAMARSFHFGGGSVSRRNGIKARLEGLARRPALALSRPIRLGVYRWRQ